MPRSLQGSASAVALSNIRDFRLGRRSPVVEQAFTRDVFAEVLDRHMGAEKLDPVFPGYSPKRNKFLGFLKG